MNVPIYARLKQPSAKIHARQFQSVTSVILRCLNVLMPVPVEVNVLPVAMVAEIQSVPVAIQIRIQVTSSVRKGPDTLRIFLLCKNKVSFESFI